MEMAYRQRWRAEIAELRKILSDFVDDLFPRFRRFFHGISLPSRKSQARLTRNARRCQDGATIVGVPHSCKTRRMK